MILSDVCIRRPVFASVLALLLIAFGILSFTRLPLREFPDIDPPVVSIRTAYRGASAAVVESRITEPIERQIAGVEGIDFIESSSRDGRSDISISFMSGRDIDAAANDVRDRVASILNNLPVEADPPEISKVDSNDDVILWLNLVSPEMSTPELTDYARRFLVDRFSVLDGVAQVRVGGQQTWSMRVWLDRTALAAREITVADVESALRAENIELPAGSIESRTRQFTIRTERAFQNADDFARLVVARGEDGYLVRLGDVARVERAPIETRTLFRGNSEPMIGIGIIKQSTANTIEVARGARELAQQLNETLPDGMEIRQSFDSSVFVEGAIREVYRTLALAIGLVVLVIYLFLGSGRAMLVPAATVPVSLISTFIALNLFGFSINILTLLALVLSIGLVVDDAIVVLENIFRRIDEEGETPLVAAYRGARQVGFAVVATTLVLISVFVPIAFMEGDIGRLFSEFALTIAAAVGFSSLIALTLAAMLASKILKRKTGRNPVSRAMDAAFHFSQRLYTSSLAWMLRHRWVGVLLFLGIASTSWFLVQRTPSEYTPREDRGAFFLMVNGPEGASFEYTRDYMEEIERRLMPYVENREITRLLVRAPRAFGLAQNFNDGMVIIVLNDWSERRPAFDIMNEIRARLSDLPGVTAFPIMRQGFGGRAGKPVRFIIGGPSYEVLAEWRDTLLRKIEENNPGLSAIDWDYKETQPQIRVRVDYDRAAELGITIGNIGRTLETMLGSRRVTTYIDDGEEYDVVLEGERDAQRTPASLENIHVRSERHGRLIPLSSVVSLQEYAGSTTLNRYNRVRSITIEANLDDGYTLGEALDFLNGLVQEHLPSEVVIDYRGESREFTRSGGEILFVFALGIVIVFLVLAAQFESYVHPVVIMLTVPLAIAGGLAGIALTGGSLNIYSQIGLIMLVGLAAKNGILIVEFTNQLRDQGTPFDNAIMEAARVRLRPIVMTGITTAASTIPLILSFGAGAETRMVIGTVILAGILSATAVTLYIVPVGYSLIARGTGSPGDVTRRLFKEAGGNPDAT